MKIIENKQSRLRHYISAPKRFLRRAWDFYVDSLVTFDDKVASAPATTYTPHPPKNFGGCSPSKVDDNEIPEELYRLISNKYEKQRMSVMDRSYSIAVGKMGRIDEEEACEFKERVVMFPRSRSHAATGRSGTAAFY